MPYTLLHPDRPTHGRGLPAYRPGQWLATALQTAGHDGVHLVDADQSGARPANVTVATFLPIVTSGTAMAVDSGFDGPGIPALTAGSERFGFGPRVTGIWPRSAAPKRRSATGIFML